MISFIEQMREKPLHARKRFAFMVALGITGIVAVGWSLTLPARFDTISIQGKGLAGSSGAAELGAQLQGGKENIQNLIDLTEGVEEYGRAAYEESFAEEKRDAEVDSGKGVLIATTSSATMPPSLPRSVMIATTSAAIGSTSSLTP